MKRRGLAATQPESARLGGLAPGEERGHGRRVVAGLGGGDPIAAEQRAGDGALLGRAENPPPAAAPGSASRRTDGCVRPARAGRNEQPEQVMALPAPSAACFTSEYQEAVRAWTQEFWVAALLAAAGVDKGDAVLVGGPSPRGAIPSEGRDESCVAAQSMPQRGGAMND